MLVVAVIAGFALGALLAWLVARERLHAMAAELARERSSGEGKAALLSGTRAELEAAIKALAADALKSNNESFLALARTQLEQKEKAVEHLVEPLERALEQIARQTQELEQSRRQAYGSLAQQLRSVVETQERLRTETSQLVTALRAPQVRGRWGEIQLRRVVEMAGMVAHCDFVEQQTATVDGQRLRPDLVVKLPGGKNVVVDAKAPLQAYLDAIEARDEAVRTARLADHARQIRDHITKLSTKSYWSQFERTPEFVVLFIPGETFFSAALEQDPGLIEEGVNQQVILATPTTLIALLRAVAYGWRQETIAENAKKVEEQGRELYKRLATLTEHFARVGRGLDSAVRAYNDTVGSLERSVLPGARRFKEHGITPAAELAELAEVERGVRPLQAAEPAPAPDAADEPRGLPVVDAA
jgi:DNA recombination protein RmuC